MWSNIRKSYRKNLSDKVKGMILSTLQKMQRKLKMKRPETVEGIYCKRPIQCLASSKVLTPTPLTARRTPPAPTAGGTHSLGGEGVGGQ
jgi:hypothetical protein